MQTMQRFFKFFRRKILSVEWVDYSLQTPLLKKGFKQLPETLFYIRIAIYLNRTLTVSPIQQFTFTLSPAFTLRINPSSLSGI